MISYRLTVDDLAELRFACSPLLETVTSLWALRWPARHVLHLPWIRDVRAALIDLRADEFDILDALLSPDRGWLPDFVTPRPDTPLPRIEDELRRVRTTSLNKVQADLRTVYGDQPVPTVLCQEPTVIANAIEAYWRLAIEPYWPRMRAVLEADMLHRARVIARDGAAAMLTELDHRVRWDGGELRLYAGQTLTYDTAVAGRGIWLVPALFVPQTISPVGPAEPPTVAYQARGIGTLWESQPSRSPEALAELMGKPRAHLLVSLEGPMTTTDLARRLGVTPSAVSQHLRVLHKTGLLNRARVGRVVLYARTELGDRLIAPA